MFKLYEVSKQILGWEASFMCKKSYVLHFYGIASYQTIIRRMYKVIMKY